MNETFFTLSVVSLVSTTFLLGLALFAVILSYRKMLKKLFELQQKQLQDGEQSGKEAERILAEARQKALEIISQAESFSEQQKQALGATLAGVSQDVKQTSLELMKQDFKEFLSSLDKELAGKKDEMKNELSEQYKKEYEQVRSELNVYKEEVMKRVSDQVRVILRDVSLKVFGKAISYDQHEELIVQALEEAKKTHVL